MTPARKRSGANVEEWQRRGTKVQFRLSEEERTTLHYLAAREGLSLNEYAARATRRALVEGWRTSS